MKILLLCGKMESGGAETHVSGLALELIKRGHTVFLASAGGREAKKLASAGVGQIILPLDRKDLFSLMLCRQRLMRLVREKHFDIMHAHTRISAYVADDVSRALQVLLVVTAHARFDMRGLCGRASRWGDKTICVSSDIREHIMKHARLKEENVSVIPNGIDTKEFCSGTRRSSEKLRIAFLSRLDSDCSAAAYSLIRIAPALIRKFPNVEIVIGGGGSELPEIREYARRVNLALGKRAIRLVGHVNCVPRFYSFADIFVGVSRAALEAFSCCVPTVLAGNEGFGGVVSRENIGELAKENFCCRGRVALNDRRLLFGLCRLLCMTENERESLGRTLRAYVRENCSQERVTEQTERVYNSLAERKRGNILLCGYYGYGNIGDDILLRKSIVRARREYPQLKVCAMTANGSRDKNIFGVRCVRRKHMPSVMREIRGARVLVFGGGTLLQNKTSYRSLLYYLFIAFYAIRHGVEVVLWANGLGEIRGALAKRGVARLLCKCRYVGLRDGYSLSLARHICIGGNASIGYERDMAFESFHSKSGRAEEILMSLGINKEQKIVIVAPRGTETHECIKKLSHSVREEIKQGKLPIYVAMYPHEDTSLCKSAERILGGVSALWLSADEIEELMCVSDKVIGMRYHALVLAVNANAPYVAIGSQKKIKYFRE